ncbi:MAG: DNA (cytosine-5-)-methyltransferase [Candidatus Cloacimonetes bacterium]|nr:DNA (cytosine-5-)-methyltransferase [Candidatus Cloacimonadota bacterium]
MINTKGETGIEDIKDDTRMVRKVLYWINEIIEKVYKTPDLGNKVDPLEELLYLVITQRTRIELARKIFEEFRKKFYPWEKVLVPANQDNLKQILVRGGRGNLRYRAVTEIITEINKRVGKTSLEFLRKYSLEEAKEFLLSLPWTGKKTAYCILMYSLGHPVFPVDSNIMRIFKRTNILGSVGVLLEGVDHRTAQKKIAPFIPRDITYHLHVNLVMHGRKLCLERNLGCHICPIQLFCAFYRDSQHKESLNFRLTMVDLFSGAGGISYGFVKAGIRPILAVDNYKPACETYSLNIPWIDRKKVINRDITGIKNEEIKKLTAYKRVDILVAGVPCQGFSKVGLKSKPSLREERPPEKEEVNKLFMEVVRWTEILKPSIILLENVPDMGSSKIFFKDSNVSVRELLEKNFARLDYSTATVCLNSADFGMPQVRKRLFFIASRGKIMPGKFDEELLKFWNELNKVTDKENSLPLKIALQGIPVLNPEEGENAILPLDNYPDNHDLKTQYEKFVYNNPRVIFNHVVRNHNDDDMLIISSLEKGENYKKLVERKPEVIMKRKRKIYSITNFHDKFYRLNPEKPCRTIVSHLSKDGNSFIHPFENRSITVREAARVQSFPDNFMFTGSRTAQFIQVGNAVPPLLAHIVGLFFAKLLEKGRDTDEQ